MTNFGASAPGPSPRKTGAPTRIGAAVFHFEWIASGLTEVCFWTAPRPVLLKLYRGGGRWIAVLEDRVKFDLGWTLPGPIESE